MAKPVRAASRLFYGQHIAHGAGGATPEHAGRLAPERPSPRHSPKGREDAIGHCATSAGRHKILETHRAHAFFSRLAADRHFSPPGDLPGRPGSCEPYLNQHRGISSLSPCAVDSIVLQPSGAKQPITRNPTEVRQLQTPRAKWQCATQTGPHRQNHGVSTNGQPSSGPVPMAAGAW
jgi:hypothetical protein